MAALASPGLVKLSGELLATRPGDEAAALTALAAGGVVGALAAAGAAGAAGWLPAAGNPPMSCGSGPARSWPHLVR